MKKVSLLLAITAIMAGTPAMAADLEALKAKDAAAANNSATATVASAPEIKGLNADLVRGAVLTYIERDVALKGREFLIYDAMKGQKTVLRLKNPNIKDAPIVQAEDCSVQPVEMTSVKNSKIVVTIDFQVRKGS